MATRRLSAADRIDQLMEQASVALVERRYADTRRLAGDALDRAHAIRDYDRMARIVLPLQEAQRQLREIALDAGRVTIVRAELPAPEAVAPGCVLVEPPRVGVDGRILREQAEQAGVPLVVLVREPATREGLWPLVSIGAITVRTRVPPPPDPALPSVAWFSAACEALGDAAIQQADGGTPHAIVDALIARLRGIPEHEKLHQRLADACREAARAPAPARPRTGIPADTGAEPDDE